MRVMARREINATEIPMKRKEEIKKFAGAIESSSESNKQIDDEDAESIGHLGMAGGRERRGLPKRN